MNCKDFIRIIWEECRSCIHRIQYRLNAPPALAVAVAVNGLHSGSEEHARARFLAEVVTKNPFAPDVELLSQAWDAGSRWHETRSLESYDTHAIGPKTHTGMVTTFDAVRGAGSIVAVVDGKEEQLDFVHRGIVFSTAATSAVKPGAFSEPYCHRGCYVRFNISLQPSLEHIQALRNRGTGTILYRRAIEVEVYESQEQMNAASAQVSGISGAAKIQ